MFRPLEIQARLKEQPFRPLRIIASEGLHYDVFHPDLVMVGERDIQVGLPMKHHPTIYNRIIRVAIAHIVGLEDLPAATPPTPTNGPPA